MDYHMEIISAPYLPNFIANNKKFTLVLDLDETLIHYVEMMTCTNNIE